MPKFQVAECKDYCKGILPRLIENSEKVSFSTLTTSCSCVNILISSHQALFKLENAPLSSCCNGSSDLIM